MERLKQRRKPRDRSLVRLRDSLSGSGTKSLPFKPGISYLFLGEIANMPEHCVVAEQRTGRLFTGYHTDNFVEIPDDEV